MTPNEEMSIAYHEAGHAVALIAQGQPCEDLTVIAGDGYLGRCLHPSVAAISFSTLREAKQLGRQQIIVCLAGGEAERLSGFISPNGENGSNQDIENALHISEQYSILPRDIRFARDPAHMEFITKRLAAEARRLMKRQWQAVSTLARLLVERKTITGDEVERIVRPLLKS